MNILESRPQTEIDFLSRQNMVFDNSARTTIGTLATITPADNETFVLLGAHVSVTSLALAIACNFKVELRNESNVRDILSGANVIGGGSSSSQSLEHDFSLVRGDVLEGDGIKTYTLEWTVKAATNIAGSLYGYLRNT